MIVRDIITKTYRIIRNWSDTMNRWRMIVVEVKNLKDNSNHLIQEIKSDWLDLEDLSKLQQWTQKIWTDGEKIVDEVSMFGEKIKEEV